MFKSKNKKLKQLMEQINLSNRFVFLLNFFKINKKINKLDICQKEIERTHKKMPGMSKKPREVVENDLISLLVFLFFSFGNFSFF